jgi:hypothetical protein
MNQSLSYEFPEPIALAIESDALSSLTTIQQRTNAVDTLGQVDLADWTDIPGLINIQSMLAVFRPATPDKAAMMRRPEEIDTSNYRHNLLNGYYPSILQQHRAIVDGIPYEMYAVEHDSQHTMTRLALRIYTQ